MVLKWANNSDQRSVVCVSASNKKGLLSFKLITLLTPLILKRETGGDFAPPQGFSTLT